MFKRKDLVLFAKFLRDEPGWKIEDKAKYAKAMIKYMKNTDPNLNLNNYVDLCVGKMNHDPLLKWYPEKDKENEV